MKVLDKRTGKLKYRMFDAEPGFIRCPQCGLNLSPVNIYDKGSYYLHGKDFCPKCRGAFYLSPVDAARLNAEIKKQKREYEEELRLEKQQRRFFPVREETNKEDWRNIPDAY